MPDVPAPAVAATLAGALLASVGDRWPHVKAVAARADELSQAVPVDDRELLIVAAWWHDLGYAPGLLDTGMHQVDGARFLEAMHYPDRLASLVAHHSAAEYEAAERGLDQALRHWPREDSAVADALWTADMTTGPRGERLSYNERYAEIMSRYETDSIVGRAMTAARPLIIRAIEDTETRLSAARQHRS